jgi:hypothetical protein
MTPKKMRTVSMPLSNILYHGLPAREAFGHGPEARATKRPPRR